MKRVRVSATARVRGKMNLPLHINLSMLPGDVVHCYRLVILMGFQFHSKRGDLCASLGHFEVQTRRLAFPLQGEGVGLVTRFVLGSGLGYGSCHVHLPFRARVGSSPCLVIRHCFRRVRNSANKRFEMNDFRSFQIPVGPVPDA